MELVQLRVAFDQGYELIQAAFEIGFDVEYLRKAFTKKRKKEIVNDIFIAVLLRLYDLNYLISTKSRLSNQKSDMMF